MNTTEEAPADWDLQSEDDKKKKAGQSAWLNNESFKDGKKQILRILQGPYAVGEIAPPFGSKIVFKLPDPKNEGKTVDRYRVKVPLGTTVPGWPVKTKYVFEVLVVEGDMAGSHKIWEVGPQIKDQLQAAKAGRQCKGDIKNADFEVYMTKGKNDKVEWKAIPGPLETSITPEMMTPVFNLKEKVLFATKEDLEALPPPPDKQEKKISKAQVQVISDLAQQKEQSDALVCKRIERMFPGKKELDDLTTAEASQLIDTLKAL